MKQKNFFWGKTIYAYLHSSILEVKTFHPGETHVVLKGNKTGYFKTGKWNNRTFLRRGETFHIAQMRIKTGSK